MIIGDGELIIKLLMNIYGAISFLTGVLVGVLIRRRPRQKDKS